MDVMPHKQNDMKRLEYLIISLLITISGFTQENADELNRLKGNPLNVELIFKNRLFHHDSNWRYLYTFNDLGKIKTQQNFENGILRAEYHYNYDSLKNKILEECFDIVNHKDSSEKFTTKFIFDNKSRIKQEILMSHGNRIMWIKDSIIYNDHNLPVRYILISPPYNDKGVKTQNIIVLTYNDKGFISSIKVDDSGGGFNDSYYSYNDNGDISRIEINEMTFFNNKRVVAKRELEYSYKYDEFSNWIKRFTKHDNSKKYLDLKRVIKYKKNYGA